MTPAEFFERFATKIDRRGDDECWPWIGSLKPNGYGFVDLYENGDGSHRRVYAHRLAAGEPAGLIVRHLCHNPPCVNPRHLAPGTHSDNMADMVKAGRSRAILTPDEAALVRQVVAAGVTSSSIAAFTGASRTTISRAAIGRTFTYLGPLEVPRNRGERHLRAKFSTADVIAIRARAARGEKLSALAAEFSVTPQAIHLIVRRKAWKHVA